MNAHAPLSKTVTIGGALKRVVTIEELNNRFALLEQDGSPSVFVSRRDFLPLQDCDLRRRLANEVVEVDMKDGKPIYAAAFKVWSGHADRHVYRRVVFTSESISADCLNLFRGFGVTPKAGNCEKIFTHIRDVICAGGARDADAMLKLLAWQIQNIGKPSRIVTVLKSEKQQAGKGVLLNELMAKIYGPSGFTAAATDQILGRFNSALRGRAFVFLDEVLFAGDRKAADGIKSLSTATIIGIEEKGLPIVQCPVAVNLWLASNHDAAAHIA
ncbi:MAG: primase-helicase family protein [Methylocystis silviterrae]|uniref:primase-helicase family protein n=1 Tax=Methylocystis silviterrae TaxID=2743612 RepID=UPI003BD9CCDF